MAKILSFDSVYMTTPLRWVYLALIKNISNKISLNKNAVVLYKLDVKNIFIRDKRNVSGMPIDVKKDHIDAMSMAFYKYLERYGCQGDVSINGMPLYEIYTRQIRLKLSGILRCAFRIKKISIESEGSLEIITDKQTAVVMRETFKFIDFQPDNIEWKANGALTVCVYLNSLIMRFASIFNMYFSLSKLPKEYYYKYTNKDAPTVLITMPIRRPEDFYSTYVEKFNNSFNIILYSMGKLCATPKNYKRIRVRQSKKTLRIKFNNSICCSVSSYIKDIMLIYKNHVNLGVSVDVVNSVFSNNIDIVINRLQTSIVDNQIANNAKKRGIFVLCDVFEETYYCDLAIIPSKSRDTGLMRLALSNGANIIYKENNSLISYRLKGFNNKKDGYLHELLKIDGRIKIIFYASDPLKEENQRYLTEKFLFKYFSCTYNTILVIKTHPQDNGRITNYAYLDSEKPSNVILIGDVVKKRSIASKTFKIFDDFDFNLAVNSSDGFLTTSSSSIFQALMLGVKTGVVDVFNNGYYDYLVDQKAIILINDEKDLQSFIKNKKLYVSKETISYCGLNDKEFDVAGYLLENLSKINKNKIIKKYKNK